MWSSDVFATLLVVVYIAAGFTAAVMLSLRRKPATAIAWILTIIFIPLIGLVAFLLIGVGRLPKHRRERQREVNQMMLQRSNVVAHTIEPETPDWLASAVRLNRTLGALPMLAANTTQLIEEYGASLQAMAEDIEHAQEYVHLEFYILVKDQTTAVLFDALERARARGVTVRVLSDHVSGLMFPNRTETRQALASMGAEWHAMLPLRPFRGQWQRPDMRNHRKLLVVDGHIGYTGSQNLIDASYLKPKNIRKGLQWKELMVRVTGPVVGELGAVFATDWLSETGEMLAVSDTVSQPAKEMDPERSISAHGTAPVRNVAAQVIPSGPTFENDNNLKLFVHMIQNARQRVSITSPYFVPDESTLLALVTAASRGLDVELFVSEVADQFLVYHAQRSYYSALLDAGVKIYLYRAPTVLHSKHFSIDDDVAVIGSSNMDIRSFSINMEISVLLHSTELTTQLRAVEDHYRAQSRQLQPEAWSGRPFHEKIGDALARLTSALQ